MDREGSPSDSNLNEVLRVLAASVRKSCPAWLVGEADDLVQEAAIKIMERLRKGEGNPTVSSSYLWRVGYSVVIDEIRRRRRRREVALESQAETHIRTRSPGPDDLAGSRDLANGVADCVSRLSEDRRRAVTMRLIGYGVGELAENLGWPYKKAENLLFRGMKDLRRCLMRKGLEP